MKCYLSGAIEAASEKDLAWRYELVSWLSKELGHIAIDPVQMSQDLIQAENAEEFRSWKSTDPERFKSFVRKIIAQDTAAVIDESQYIICNWTKSVKEGAGTQGEVTMAYLNRIPVYLVYDGKMDELSSWIIGCSTEIFPNFKSLKAFLINEFGVK